MYSFDIEEIKQALLQAHARGVKISLLYAQTNQIDFDIFWADAFETIPPIYIGGNIESSNYSMHHKFMLIDPELPSGRLLTGSWNWSYLQEDLDPNILLETTTPEIVKSYYHEARRLLNGYNGFNKFKLPDFRPWTDQIDFEDGSKVEVWFSPGRERYSIQNRILDLINSATETIDIANTVVDSTEIASSIIGKAKDGLQIRIIFDHLNLEPEKSIYNYLLKRQAQFHLDNLQLIIGGEADANEEGLYSIFHHHNLIIDQRVVLTGTANWTFGGFFLNDENFLVLYNQEIAKKFTDNFNNYLKTLPANTLAQ
jgi:phosphatidylserine/phosphatidylglycerophosphate/cardiolipin synthase-like enzyme